MPKNIIFSISGGIGKSVVATAVVKAIKKKFPNDNLIVITAYPDVFLNNENVYKCLQHGNLSYFFTDYIKNKECIAMMHDPYLEEDYFQNRKHLVQVWCEMFDVPYNGEQPELFLTKREIDFYQKKYVSDKAIMVMQTNGGFNKEMKYSFARDLPSCAVVKIVDHFKDKYNIVHVRREDQIPYANTTPLHATFREILCVTMLSQKRLLIDSFLQHSCMALNLKSTVCWITNSPSVVGYDLHDNILANPFTTKPELKHSFLSEFDIGGNPIEFPYNSEDEIFDVQKIIDSLEKI